MWGGKGILVVKTLPGNLEYLGSVSSSMLDFSVTMDKSYNYSLSQFLYL